MTTLSAAIDALVKVAHDNFIAAGGLLLPNMVWETCWPFGYYKDTAPTVFVYDNAGTAQNQGLGTVKAWRYPRVRVEAFANKYVDAMAIMEQLRTAWITDFNFSPVNTGGVAGQGYLRHLGIKYITVGEHYDADWDRRQIVFRRIADVTIEIGD